MNPGSSSNAAAGDGAAAGLDGSFNVCCVGRRPSVLRNPVTSSASGNKLFTVLRTSRISPGVEIKSSGGVTSPLVSVGLRRISRFTVLPSCSIKTNKSSITSP